jgi:hypothetical protein
VGVRTRDQPDVVHSLGLVARVPGVARGGNVPVGACAACRNGTDIMRFGPGAGLRVDMVVRVHPKLFPWPSCGRAAVDVVISGTPGFWRGHTRLGGQDVMSQIAVGWDRFTTLTPPADLPAKEAGSPALASFYDDRQAALKPAFYVDSDLIAGKGAHPVQVRGFPPAAPLGLRFRIFDWAGPPDHLKQYALHLHFAANWVATRGFASCYVVLPSLEANGALAGTEHALSALVRRRRVAPRLEAQAQPPSFGSVALASTGPVSLADTDPAPTDYEAVFVGTSGTLAHRSKERNDESGGRLGPVWRCAPADDLTYLHARAPRDIPGDQSYVGDACGAVAVVDAPGAADFRAVFLIVMGVLIALAFEWLLRAGRKTPRADRDDPEAAAAERVTETV